MHRYKESGERMDSGYICLNRKIRDSWIWDFDNPKLALAWIDILMLANWKDKRKYISGKPVEIKRGSVLTSYVSLGERWGVHRDTARKWVKLFERDKMVSTKSNNHMTLITVENYERYQIPVDVESATDSAPDSAPDSAQLKKGNNNIIISNDIIRGTDVPQATVRQRVIDKWNELPVSSIQRINPNTNRYKMLMARVKEYGVETVLEAIDNVSKSSFLLGQSGKFVITFDWFIRPNNFPKVLEGNYTDGTGRDSTYSLSDDEFNKILGNTEGVDKW